MGSAEVIQGVVGSGRPHRANITLGNDAPVNNVPGYAERSGEGGRTLTAATSSG